MTAELSDAVIEAGHKVVQDNGGYRNGLLPQIFFAMLPVYLAEQRERAIAAVQKCRAQPFVLVRNADIADAALKALGGNDAR